MREQWTTFDWTANASPSPAPQVGLAAQYGIRVNAVLPAEVLTPLYEAWVGRQPDPEAALKHISAQIPLEGRMTTAA